MDIKETQPNQETHSEPLNHKNSLYSIPDPTQKSMDELILSIREKLQQILRQA